MDGWVVDAVALRRVGRRAGLIGIIVGGGGTLVSWLLQLMLQLLVGSFNIGVLSMVITLAAAVIGAVVMVGWVLVVFWFVTTVWLRFCESGPWR